MITALQFIDILEEKDLLPPDLVRLLRDRIQSSPDPVTAVDVAKRLIKMERLTPALAERILTTPYRQPQAEEDDDLGLVPLEDEKPKDEKPEPDELGLAPMDDEPSPPKKETPRPPAAKTKPRKAPKEKPPAEKPPEQAEVPSKLGGSLLDEEMGLSAGEPGGGPLDNLLADTAMDTSLAAEGSPLAPVAGKRRGLRGLFSRKKVPGRKTNVWDSPLMLVGGGTLLGLIILGAILLYLQMRQSGDELLQLANDDYRAGSYTQAIYKYNVYLEKCPGHDGVSLARVRRGLAQLRQAAESGGNWPKSLEVANKVLAKIAPEDDFREARSELASLLPAIAEGLAKKARETLDLKMVTLSREALALVDKYVPKSLRPSTRLDDINASLALAERQISYGKELAKAVAAIGEAVTKSEPGRAYQIRRALLKDYPEAADDLTLQKAMLAISQAEQATVKRVDKPQAAQATERPTPLLATTTLARRETKQEVPADKGQVVFALAEGGAYALDASTGKVLWRRFVGYDVDGRSPAFPPTPVDAKAGSDAILVDAAHNELLRVESASGKLRWRHPLEEPFDAHPVVADGQLLIATRGGRLVSIDLASGESSGYTQLPQQLRVAPAVDARRSSIYQVAEHSNLFVLSSSGGECRQVVYLGHELGSITAGPIVAGGFLIVAENDLASNGRLRVLSLDAEGEAPAGTQVQSLRLKGHVDRPPRVSGSRLLVTTDRAAYYVFELSGTDPKTPLMKVAEITAAGEEGIVHFALFARSRFWIADNQLARYDVQASRGRLVPKWIVDETCGFLMPPEAVGQAVVGVRRKPGVPGVLVAAVDAEEGGRLWQTHLAAHLAAEPIVDTRAGGLTAVTSSGGMYRLDLASVKGQTVVDRPTLAVEMAELGRPLADVIQLGAGRLALSTASGSKQIIVYDPQQTQNRFQRCALPYPLACLPVAFGGGLLAPCRIGQVFLVDPLSSANLMEPFQPRLEAGEKLNWHRPAVADGDTIIMADGAKRLYRLGVKKTPKPHLVALAQVDLDEEIVSSPAVIGTTAYIADAGDTLSAFELPELNRGKQWPLSGKCTWGPTRLGDCVLAASEDELFCLSADQKLRWRIELPHGRLVGAPLALDGKYLLATASGVVWAADPATGKELAKLELGRPLSTGPVAVADQLLLGGQDGSLYRIKRVVGSE